MVSSEIETALARDSAHGWKLRCGLAGCEMSSRKPESFDGSRYACLYLLLPSDVSGAAGSIVVSCSNSLPARLGGWYRDVKRLSGQ